MSDLAIPDYLYQKLTNMLKTEVGREKKHGANNPT